MALNSRTNTMPRAAALGTKPTGPVPLDATKKPSLKMEARHPQMPSIVLTPKSRDVYIPSNTNASNRSRRGSSTSRSTGSAAPPSPNTSRSVPASPSVGGASSARNVPSTVRGGFNNNKQPPQHRHQHRAVAGVAFTEKRGKRSTSSPAKPASARKTPGLAPVPSVWQQRRLSVAGAASTAQRIDPGSAAKPSGTPAPVVAPAIASGDAAVPKMAPLEAVAAPALVPVPGFELTPAQSAALKADTLRRRSESGNAPSARSRAGSTASTTSISGAVAVAPAANVVELTTAAHSDGAPSELVIGTHIQAPVDSVSEPSETVDSLSTHRSTTSTVAASSIAAALSPIASSSAAKRGVIIHRTGGGFTSPGLESPPGQVPGASAAARRVAEARKSLMPMPGGISGILVPTLALPVQPPCQLQLQTPTAAAAPAPPLTAAPVPVPAPGVPAVSEPRRQHMNRRGNARLAATGLFRFAGVSDASFSLAEGDVSLATQRTVSAESATGDVEESRIVVSETMPASAAALGTDNAAAAPKAETPTLPAPEILATMDALPDVALPAAAEAVTPSQGAVVSNITGSPAMPSKAQSPVADRLLILAEAAASADTMDEGDVDGTISAGAHVSSTATMGSLQYASAPRIVSTSVAGGLLDRHVVYCIHTGDGSATIIQRRYTDFRALYETLVARSGTARALLTGLAFPPRRAFPTLRGRVVQQRVAGLNAFLARLHSDPRILSKRVVAAFFKD